MKIRFPNLKSALYLLLLFIAANAYSQQYAAIDNMVKAYPKSFATPQKLAEKINTDFTKDEDKCRALFSWMSFNIKYDLEAFYAQKAGPSYSFTSEEDRLQKEKKFRLDMAKKCLSSKRGVCQDYCALFETVCENIGIQCATIIGKSKNNLALIGKFAKVNDHAWNAVKLGADWKLIDVTWASGSLNTQTGKMEQKFNDAYFFTTPDVFFLNHFPEDKKWLFVQKTEDDFAKLPLYYGGYLKADYKFITPEIGIFSKKETAKIPFKITNLPANDKILYVFTSENIGHEAVITKDGKTAQFDVILDKRSRGFLTIYINNESIASYKIEP